MRFCTQCGRTVPDDAKFCGFCGAPVAPAATHETSSSQTEPQTDDNPSKAEEKPVTPVSPKPRRSVGRIIGAIVLFIIAGGLFWSGINGVTQPLHGEYRAKSPALSVGESDGSPVEFTLNQIGSFDQGDFDYQTNMTKLKKAIEHKEGGKLGKVTAAAVDDGASERRPLDSIESGNFNASVTDGASSVGIVFKYEYRLGWFTGLGWATLILSLVIIWGAIHLIRGKRSAKLAD